MRKKLAVAIPLSWSHVYSPFFISWTQMLMYSSGDFEIHVYLSNSSLIDHMRELLADEALSLNPDYILWLDADQVYPIDTMIKLAKHVDDGHLVVGGITPDKHTGRPMVYNFVGERGSTNKVRSFEVDRGLVKVDAMGFGGIMTHPSVFKTIGTPYFQRTWNPEMETLTGEDFCFYTRCRKAGVDVWCDTDLHYSHMVAQVVNLNKSPVCQTYQTAKELEEKEIKARG